MAQTIEDPTFRALFVEGLNAAIADPEAKLREAREAFQILTETTLRRLDADLANVAAALGP